MNLEILHEDDFLLAINKPAAFPVIPARGLPADAALTHHIQRRFGFKPFVVHRLDKETTGVLIFAKTPEVHRVLSLAFENHQVEKIYRAWVVGIPPKKGEIALPIRQFSSGRCGVDQKKGKPAKTFYRLIRSGHGFAELEVRPETGRRHQIRVHLCAIGHPVAGDPLYGPPPRPAGGVQGLRLHAERLTFSHPRTGEPVTLSAPSAAGFALF